MPIGKDSIKTRVAKVAPAEVVDTPAPETVEVKAPAKKAAPKKPAAPKAPKADAPVAAPAVETAVLTNVAPETVAAVIGHDEKKAADKVKIGQKLPAHLL